MKRSIRARVDGGGNVGVIVGIVDSSGARYYGHGRVSWSSTKAPDENTVFEIGSITKVFTALLLAEMVG
ncbi:MAG: serine hydrolase, partial [Bacteroidetes bacterium]|nr:serine hydrolase [Bacteroidota bacterium]